MAILFAIANWMALDKKKEILTNLQCKPLYNINCSEKWGKNIQATAFRASIMDNPQKVTQLRIVTFVCCSEHSLFCGSKSLLKIWSYLILSYHNFFFFFLIFFFSKFFHSFLIFKVDFKQP